LSVASQTTDMGYECPVCGEPQADAEHLANHLAFSALLGREGHEAWLDDHAPDWEAMGPGDLAPVVADHAPGAEVEAGTDAGHDHRFEDALARRGGYGRDADGAFAGGDFDPDEQAILEEAREMTREMYGGEAAGDEGGRVSDEDGGGDSEDRGRGSEDGEGGSANSE
jgi:hypothetical protein